MSCGAHRSHTTQHQVHVEIGYHSVCPLVEIGILPPPLSPASVPSPRNREGGGGAHSPVGDRLGESQFRRLEKTLSTLPTLWPRSISLPSSLYRIKSDVTVRYLHSIRQDRFNPKDPKLCSKFISVLSVALRILLMSGWTNFILGGAILQFWAYLVHLPTGFI
jgi:hypothetical protein